MYYNNSLATAPVNTPADVWSNGYISVWHLAQDPTTGAQPRIIDSTGLANLTTAGPGLLAILPLVMRLLEAQYYKSMIEMRMDGMIMTKTQLSR